ncbi:MAG: PAS domain S-box-containing protein [Nitrospinales bacterium]|jgi:PAS domain S-box-containing protein
MSLKLKLKSKLLIGGSVSLILFSILSIISLINISLVRETFWWVDHTQEVLKKANKIEKLIVDMETGQRGFLITGKEEFLEPYNLGKINLPIAINEIMELLRDNPSQADRVNKVSTLLDEWQKKAGSHEIKLRRRVNRGEIPQAKVVFAIESKLGKDLIDDIRSKLEKFKNVETDLMVVRDRKVDDSISFSKNIVIYGSILAIVISFYVFSRISRSITTPILDLVNVSQKEFQQTLASELSSMKRGEDEIDERNKDEIDKLVKAYYQMLNALKDEIVKRKSIEEKLNISHSILEKKVKERTAELSEAYDALKESENKIRLITDSLPVLISYIDTEYRYQFNSKEYENWFGIPINEFQGKYVQDILGEESFKKVKKYFDAALSGKKVDYETFMPYKHGPKRHVHAKFIPDVKHQGSANGFFVLVTDITKRKQAEKELIKSKEESEFANKAKSEFLARMSHELRTPMNSILGFTQLLEMNAQSNLSTIDKKNLRTVSSAGKHLLKLINEVLDLSRVESGNMELSIEAVDIAPIVDNVISYSKSLANEKGVSIEYQKIPEDFYLIEADPLRFKQVVLNLISNAIKYNKPNGSVIVSFEVLDKSMGRLGIRDTGHGIAEDMRDKVFKPFERLDVDAAEIEGTGIGLTISKQLVELMGGAINYESTLGEGSYFYIDMPISDKAPLIQKEEKTIIIQNSSSNNYKKKILYIEDIRDNVELVRQILDSRQDIGLISASNALAGIELAQSEIPDLILMDIHMPDMDGITAFKKLQTMKETLGIPVIALTADAMAVDIKKALDIGFKSYITKPIDVVVFLKAIDEVVA